MAAQLPRMSETTKRVLTLILENRDTEFYGLDLAKRSGLQNGTVYAILERLEKYGWLEARWEHHKKSSATTRPLRRYYKLTEGGYKLAAIQIRTSGSRSKPDIDRRNNQNKYRNSGSVRFRSREETGYFDYSAFAGIGKYDIEVDPATPVNIRIPLLYTVGLEEKRPWTIDQLLINRIDYSDNFKIQDGQIIHDLDNSQTTYKSLISIPSDIDKSGRSIEVELAISFISPKSSLLVQSTVVSLYQTDI